MEGSSENGGKEKEEEKEFEQVSTNSIQVALKYSYQTLELIFTRKFNELFDNNIVTMI